MRTPYPDRHSLVSQCERNILQSIDSGGYSGHLPPELKLAEELGVSRSTIRKALARLVASGVIGQGRQGHPKPILRTPRLGLGGSAVYRICLLLPGTAEAMNGPGAQIALLLGERFRSGDHVMTVHHPDLLEVKRPAKSLSRLVSDRPADLWILVGQSRAVCAWFAREELPAIACSGGADGTGLPIVAADGAAAVRAALAELQGMGHRRFVLLYNFQHNRVGQTFLEEISAMGPGHHGAWPELGADREGIWRGLQSLPAASSCPTGFVTGCAQHSIVVQQWLAATSPSAEPAPQIIQLEHDTASDMLAPPPVRYGVAIGLLVATLAEQSLLLLETQTCPVLTLIPPSRIEPA